MARPEGWPQPLRTALRLLLNTGHPMYIWWGPDLLCFYNDAYAQSIGPERHPGSLGKPARQVWDEIWPIIGPQIDQVMSGGGATWQENALIPITRNGKLDDVYWTYSYGPIDDETAADWRGRCSCRLYGNHRDRPGRAATRRRIAAPETPVRTKWPGFIIIMGGPEHRVEFVNDAHRATFNSGDWAGKTIGRRFPSLAGQGFSNCWTTSTPVERPTRPMALKRDIVARRMRR